MTAALDANATVMSDDGFAAAFTAFEAVYKNTTARGATITQLTSAPALCMPLLAAKSSSPCVALPYLLYECANRSDCTFFGNASGGGGGSEVEG